MEKSQLEKIANFVRQNGFCASVIDKGVLVFIPGKKEGEETKKIIRDNFEAMQVCGY